MYRGLGDPIDPSATDLILAPDLTAGPNIPAPNSGTATALLRASITANVPSASDVLTYGTLADKVSLIPSSMLWIGGAGVLALLLMKGGRR